MGVPDQSPKIETRTADRKRHTILLGVLFLLALGLRLARITYQPLWWDEGWSMYFATIDVGSMLQGTAVDIHPPLYYLLLHVWTGIVDSSVFSVRMLSALIGAVTVPLIYATGRRQLGPKGGLMAALLLTISPFHIYYSQEARMYGLVTLLGLLALYFCLSWRLNDGGPRPIFWLGYVLAATAALYTQYYAAFLLLGLNLAMIAGWLRARRSSPNAGRSFARWLAAQALVAVLFVPWLWYAGGKLVTYVRFKVSVEGDPAQGVLTYIGHHLAAFNWGHAEGLLAGWWWLGLLPLAVLLLCLALPLIRRSRNAAGAHQPFVIRYAALGILLTTLLFGFVVNLLFPFHPPRGERLLLLGLPAYLLLFASGLLTLWRYRRPLAFPPMITYVIIALLSLAFFYTVPRYPDDDYRPVAARVSALALPTDAVICVHPWQVGYFQAYIPDDEARPSLVLTPREVIPRERQLWADDPTLMAADLDALLAEHGRLWLTDHRAMGRVLEKQIEAHLTENAYPALSEWYGENTVLSMFASGSPMVLPASGAQFGEWLTLESAALNPDPLEAGWGVVTLDLVWVLSERPGERYHIGLRLADESGGVWAQRDGTPGGGLQHFFEWALDEPHLDRHGLLVPAGTPPGDYDITLRVYRSQDVAVLPVSFEGGSGGEVNLGTIRVLRPEIPPPVEALNIVLPLVAEFGDRLRLLGLTLDSEAILIPGEMVDVDLYWQTLVDPGEDLMPRLELVGADGTSVAELTEKPVRGTYPTAWWQAGELVRDPHALPIPAAVPSGHYRLVLSLVRASDDSALEIRPGVTTIDLAQVEVQGREHVYWPTSPAFYQKEQLGSSVELVGYDMREAVRAPGSPLEITLHWQALETPGQNYNAFVHLLDDEDNIVAQHDGIPGEGQLPTLGWMPGEYLTDTHLLNLPFDLDDGDYRLEVGLYDPVTGQRPGERIILNTLIPVQAQGGCNCR